MDAQIENELTVNKAKPKKRIDYLDIAKFFAILLVILGHTTGNFDNPFYRVVIYMFHMPLFFILSGACVKKHEGKYDLQYWLHFLGKNLLALMVPYLIWGLIYGSFKYESIPSLLYGSIEKLYELNTLSSLWFLPCLFVGRVYVELMFMVSSYLKKIDTRIIAIIAAILFFTAGFLIPHPKDIGVFWCADVAFVAAGFILIGYIFKDLLNKLFSKKIWLFILILLVALGLFIVGIVCQNGSPYLVIMPKADYGNIGLFLANSITGSTIVIMLAMTIAKLFENHKTNVCYRFMLWTGCNTMGIFLIHKNFLQEVCMKGFANCGITLPHFGYAILGTILAFLFSVVVVFIIEKFIPQLFGKFPSKAKENIEKR